MKHDKWTSNTSKTNVIEHTIIFTDDLCFYWQTTSGSHLVPRADLLTETNAVWGRYLDNHIPLHQAKNVPSKTCRTANYRGTPKDSFLRNTLSNLLPGGKNWHRRCVKSGGSGTKTVWTQTGSCAFILSLMWLNAWTWFYLLSAPLVWSIEVNYEEGNVTGRAAQLWFLRRNFHKKGSIKSHWMNTKRPLSSLVPLGWRFTHSHTAQLEICLKLSWHNSM